MIKKIAPFFLFGFIVVICLSFFGDFKKTSNLIISFKWSLFPIALIFSSLNFLFRFLRWQFLLKKISVKINTKDSLLIFFSGLAMAITPLRSGELIKSSMIKKISGHKISHTASLVFVERLTDAIAMLLLMSAGLFIFNYGLILFLTSFVVCIAFIIIVNYEKASYGIINLATKTIPFIKTHEEKINNLYFSSRELMKYETLLPIVLLAFFSWLSTVIGGSFIFSLLGVEFTMINILSFSFIFCFAGALGFLTAVPGGLGVSEASVAGLSILLLHLPNDIAAAGVLITRFSTLWFGTLIGIIAMMIFYKKSST